MIPTLNEAENLRALLPVLAGIPGAEIVVTDGGSTDGTRAAAARPGVLWVEGPPGRGAQMNRGTRLARGRTLLFLHADARPSPAALARLSRDLPPAGAFSFAVDSPRRRYRLLAAAVALRCRLFRLPYGDQGLFASREVFAAAGGFPETPCLEDVAMALALRRRPDFAVLPERIFTSPRRWERRGFLRATASNLLLLAQFAAGTPLERLVYKR